MQHSNQEQRSQIGTIHHCQHQQKSSWRHGKHPLTTASPFYDLMALQEWALMHPERHTQKDSFQIMKKKPSLVKSPMPEYLNFLVKVSSLPSSLPSPQQLNTCTFHLSLPLQITSCFHHLPPTCLSLLPPDYFFPDLMGQKRCSLQHSDGISCRMQPWK